MSNQESRIKMTLGFTSHQKFSLHSFRKFWQEKWSDHTCALVFLSLTQSNRGLSGCLFNRFKIFFGDDEMVGVFIIFIRLFVYHPWGFNIATCSWMYTIRLEISPSEIDKTIWSAILKRFKTRTVIEIFRSSMPSNSKTSIFAWAQEENGVFLTR